MTKKIKGFDWSTAKLDEILHRLVLGRTGGRIWYLDYSRVKIVRINDRTIRLNYLDVNGGRGSEYAVPKEKLVEDRQLYSRSKAALFRKYVPFLKKSAENAETQLDGYTNKHPHYDWYVYTRDILQDFYELVKEGFTPEKYDTIKKKYGDFEEDQFKAMFAYN